jgi:protein SCO1/2
MEERVDRPTITLGGQFRLTNHFAQAVSDEDFLGSFLLVFFGFTNCKVVCPENLTKLSTALDLMGPLADRIQPLYVSVDPDRDHPEVMRSFLESRFPRFLGLTGAKPDVERMKQLYKVYAVREEAGPDGDYDVPHTAMTFLMGPDGKYVTHFADVVPAERIAESVAGYVLAA